jgi:hypothetical protein
MSQNSEIQQSIEKVLKIIIDEWYEKVSSFYITVEAINENPSLSTVAELKRFHDEKGHRIKFDKDDLDFTYGLRTFWEDANLMIEVSVNNKVENFNTPAFRQKLAVHYQKAGRELVPTPAELKTFSYNEVFELDSNFSDAFSVERREGKADIMRLSFRLNPDLVAKLAARPVSSKKLVEAFCVTPFRNVYASVYRMSR